MSWEFSAERWTAISNAVDCFAAYWLVQSGALILVGFLAALLLRRKGAALQSAICRTTLAAVMICPAISLAFQSLGIPCIALTSFMPKSISASPEVQSNDIRIESTSMGDPLQGSLQGSTLPPTVSLKQEPFLLLQRLGDAHQGSISRPGQSGVRL